MSNVTVEFGGFYHSIHDSLIDDVVDRYASEMTDDDFNEFYEGLNWGDIRQNYARGFMKLLAEWLEKELYIGVKYSENTIKVISPREYNFRTDTLDVDFTPESIAHLNAWARKDDEFKDYLQEATQSRDGFISFYSYDDGLADKDGILSQYALRYLCDEFIGSGEFVDAYDRACMYDDLGV